MKLKERTTAALLIAIFMMSVMAFAIPVIANDPEFDPKPKRNGWVHWVWVEVEWFPLVSEYATWDVYAYDCSGDPPKADGAEYGSLLGSSTLLMDYEFKIVGNTLQFDEEYVSGVTAHPQINHVVLHDKDGDGVYTGSDCASRYEWVSERYEYIFLDVMMYEAEINSEGNVIRFYYEEHEYYKFVEEE